MLKETHDRACVWLSDSGSWQAMFNRRSVGSEHASMRDAMDAVEAKAGYALPWHAAMSIIPCYVATGKEVPPRKGR